MPQYSQALQQKWTARITHARAHWATFHKRVRHNRNTVAGFNWNADPTGKDFYSLRANLIHGTISAVLPNVYARNPEISIAQAHSGADIHVHVPPYETNILRNLFGRENVTVFERPSKTTITPEQEYDRLCAKYGHEVVAKVFGEDDGDRLMEIVEGLMKEGQLPAQEKALEETIDQAGPHQESPETKGAKKR